MKGSQASVTAEQRAPFTAHLTFLGVFLLEGDWYLRRVAPASRAWARDALSLCAGPGKLVATLRTVPGVTLTHGGTYTKTQSCCVNGLFGGGVVQDPNGLSRGRKM